MRKTSEMRKGARLPYLTQAAETKMDMPPIRHSWYPVRRESWVKVNLNSRSTGNVITARIGPTLSLASVSVRSDTLSNTHPPTHVKVQNENRTKSRSRCQRGQFRGSLGSFDGCGIKKIPAFLPVPFLRWVVFTGRTSFNCEVPGTCSRGPRDSRMPQPI